jgi:hypothetical protein
MNCKKHIKVEDDSYFKNDIHIGFSSDFKDDFDLITAYYFTSLDHGGQSTSTCEYLFSYLDKIKKKDLPNEYDGEWYCVMFILEHNQLINSGVSIRCPWLTDLGNECYEDLEFMIKSKPIDFSAIKNGMTMIEIVKAYPEVVAKFIEKRYVEFKMES